MDGTTLEANAALRSIVRREDGVAYAEHVAELIRNEGLEEPTVAGRQRSHEGRERRRCGHASH